MVCAEGIALLGGTSMSQWDRKSLDELLWAVRKELQAIGPRHENISRLFAVSVLIVKSLDKPVENLASCRRAMCEFCRSDGFHECDIPEGWSANCAFLELHRFQLRQRKVRPALRLVT